MNKDALRTCIILINLFAVLGLNSCKTRIDDSFPNICFITNISNDGYFSIDNIYENDQIKEIDAYRDSILFRKQIFLYGRDNKINESYYFDGKGDTLIYYDYKYGHSGFLDTVFKYFPPHSLDNPNDEVLLSGFNAYKRDENNKILGITKVKFQNKDDSIFSETFIYKYFYNDSNNLIKTESYIANMDSNQLIAVSTFMYDDKNNGYNQLTNMDLEPALLATYVSMNNVIYFEKKGANDRSVYSEKYDYKEYNEGGYPIEAHVQSSLGRSGIQKFSYDCIIN